MRRLRDETELLDFVESLSFFSRIKPTTARALCRVASVTHVASRTTGAYPLRYRKGHAHSQACEHPTQNGLGREWRSSLVQCWPTGITTSTALPFGKNNSNLGTPTDSSRRIAFSLLAVFEEGDAGNVFYIVLHGAVELQTFVAPDNSVAKFSPNPSRSLLAQSGLVFPGLCNFTALFSLCLHCCICRQFEAAKDSLFRLCTDLAAVERELNAPKRVLAKTTVSIGVLLTWAFVHFSMMKTLLEHQFTRPQSPRSFFANKGHLMSDPPPSFTQRLLAKTPPSG